jgi:hypothetical protein
MFSIQENLKNNTLLKATKRLQGITKKACS